MRAPTNQAVASAVLTAAVRLWPGQAHACSPAPPGWAATVSKYPPANGSVVVSLECYWQCPALPDPPVLAIRDLKSNEIVPGTVIASAVDPATPETIATAWIVWKPGAPLVADEHYGLSVLGTMAARWETPGPDGGREIIGDFTATAAVNVVPQSLRAESAEVVPADRPLGAQVCCESDEIGCGSTGTWCFATRVSRSARIHIYMGADWDQYLHRVAFREGPAAGAWTWGGTISQDFEVGRDPYCYTLEAKSLVDNSEVALPESCLTSDVQVGERPVPAEQVIASVGYCKAPPAGYEKEWAAAKAQTTDGGCSLAARSTGRGHAPVITAAFLLALGLERRRRA